MFNYFYMLYKGIMSIYFVLIFDCGIINHTGVCLYYNDTELSRNKNFDAVHVLIINLLHNITNIYLCGGDILGNISDLASTFTITLICLDEEH